MKDTFGKEIGLGDKVLFATSGSGGCCYNKGTIEQFYPPTKCKPFDRARISVYEHSTEWGPSKDPIVYVSNLVKIEGLL